MDEQGDVFTPQLGAPPFDEHGGWKPNIKLQLGIELSSGHLINIILFRHQFCTLRF